MRQIRASGILGLCVAASLAFGIMSAAGSHEPFAVYEDWSDGKIHRERWRGGVSFGGLEVKTEAKPGKLRMRYRIEGGTGSNAGTTSLLESFLSFANPPSVDQVEAEFKVRKLTVTGCGANPTASRARPARIFLARFNDGTSTGPGDRTGDHFGFVQAFRDSSSPDAKGILRIVGFVLRCTNPLCSSSTIFSVVELPQTVKVGKLFRLRLIWDPPNDQFLAGLNENPDVPVPYAASDAAPAASPRAGLDIVHTGASCTSDAGGPTEVDTETEVHTVRTNNSAYGYGASLMGPVRPLFAWTSLALVTGAVVSQLAGWRKRRNRSSVTPDKLA
jgi:hypothetical protein